MALYLLIMYGKFKLNENEFVTLVSAAGGYCPLTKRDISHFRITHYTSGGKNYFSLQELNDDWKEIGSSYWLENIEFAMLKAFIDYGLHPEKWIIYNPPKNVKLYSNPRTRYEFRHSKVRRNAIKMLFLLKFIVYRTPINCCI